MSWNHLKKIDHFLLFNFLAKDKENALEIIEIGEGSIIPGIVASDFDDIDEAAEKVKEIKEVAPVVSIGLGGGGDPANWEKVLKIAEKSNPGHLNQPFEKSAFSNGYLTAKGTPQLINGLVAPTGKVGFIKLSSGLELKVEAFVELCASLGIQSIKFMPLKGETHLDELVYLTKVAAANGIKGIEPAGGISADNIRKIVDAVRDTGIEFFMPHIFGSTIDQETGRTISSEVNKILQLVKE
jgi:2-dehydro-3-deoxy-phosphogluconate aldolase